MPATPYDSPVPGAPASAAPTPAPQEEVVSRGVTPRVVVLCLALAVLFGYMIPIIDVKLRNTFLGAAHFPPGAIAVLLFLVLLVNPLLKMLSRRHAFSRNELLTVYISCLFSCLVPGHGAENFFVPNMIAPYYFAKAENKWLEFLNEHVPSWFTPALQGGKYGTSGANFDAVQGWYGASTTIPWALWITPLLMWGAIVFASYLMFACLSVMLRAQWSDREALAFPLLRLPVEMTEDVDRDDKFGIFGRLFRNNLTWIGVGISIFIQGLNGLHIYYPDVPAFPLEIAGNFFSELPWSQLGWTQMTVLPIVVGITYLLSSEVSFSLWFFFLFMKFQNIFAYYSGFPSDTLPDAIGRSMGAKAFASFQVVGAFLMYAFLVMWTGREHFKHVASRAFGRTKAREEEKEEALSYPVAFWGFVLSFLFIVAWCIFAGMNPLIAILMWTLYLVIAICLSRLIVEGGLLFVQQGWTPLGVTAQLLNTGPGTLLPAHSLVPASFVNASLMTDLRGFLLPSFIQSFKLAHDHKIRMKPLLALILSVTLISFVIGIYMNVRLGYDNGALTLEGWFTQGGAQKPASDIQPFLNGVDAKVLNQANWIWMGVGGLTTFLIMMARSRFLWFPLHPLGYLMGLSYPMYKLWFSILVGWLAKTVITKFGGSEAYRKLIPLFLGVVMGDVIMMIVWLVVSAFTGQNGQQLMPG